MRYIIFIVLLSGCAKSKEHASCNLDKFGLAVTYPDGQSRKSDIYQCVQVSGAACQYIVSINDPTQIITDCTEPNILTRR